MKRFYIMFWIKSSRGTDSRSLRMFRRKPTKDEIEDLLERWCSGFGAWTKSENYVTYGYRAVTKPTRTALLKKFQAVCDKKNRIQNQYDELAAMLHPHETKLL